MVMLEFGRAAPTKKMQRHTEQGKLFLQLPARYFNSCLPIFGLFNVSYYFKVKSLGRNCCSIRAAVIMSENNLVCKSQYFYAQFVLLLNRDHLSFSTNIIVLIGHWVMCQKSIYVSSNFDKQKKIGRGTKLPK